MQKTCLGKQGRFRFFPDFEGKQAPSKMLEFLAFSRNMRARIRASRKVPEGSARRRLNRTFTIW